ncbi:MAG: Nif3-like dinuclear metal center hexameric protein [Clostridiales bacterium]|nr:MAG: Nif3-like dinuclear metal center hexameric protein [Clostridiales bacterium]
MTTVQDIFQFLDEYCPFSLAESWDNPGLNAGWRGQEVHAALLAMDITPEAVLTAHERGCELIITHHPLVLDTLRQWNDETDRGRNLLRLAQNGISHIACHTNLDAAEGGVNAELAKRCGLENTVLFGGFGRIGERETTAGALIRQLKESLPAETCIGVLCHEHIKKIAVVGGSGASLLELAAAEGCDTFVTGESKHHHALIARELGINLLMFGHYETEYIALAPLEQALRARFPALSFSVMPRRAPLERL